MPFNEKLVFTIRARQAQRFWKLAAPMTPDIFNAVSDSTKLPDSGREDNCLDLARLSRGQFRLDGDGV